MLDSASVSVVFPAGIKRIAESGETVCFEKIKVQ
jgi:hypothetical protein